MWHEHLFILQRLPFFYRQFDCLTVRKKINAVFFSNTASENHGYWFCSYCIRMDEVRAALKKMKRYKAPGLSGLVTEMIQATGDTGTQ